jgi:hypothetical protein
VQAKDWSKSRDACADTLDLASEAVSCKLEINWETFKFFVANHFRIEWFFSPNCPQKALHSPKKLRNLPLNF